MKIVFQLAPLCNPLGTDLYTNYSRMEKFDCITSCQGIHADVSHFNVNPALEESSSFRSLKNVYGNLKKNLTRSFAFDKSLEDGWMLRFGKP